MPGVPPPYNSDMIAAENSVASALTALTTLQTAANNASPPHCDQETCDRAKALLQAAQDMVTICQAVKDKLCDDCSLS